MDEMYSTFADKFTPQPPLTEHGQGIANSVGLCTIPITDTETLLSALVFAGTGGLNYGTSTAVRISTNEISAETGFLWGYHQCVHSWDFSNQLAGTGSDSAFFAVNRAQLDSLVLRSRTAEGATINCQFYIGNP